MAKSKAAVVDAQRAYQAQYRQDHLEERRANQRQYHKDHPNQIIEWKERKAGRPMPDVCEVCNRPPLPGKRLHFDHDHMFAINKFGDFRGWLCQGCNLALGWVGDDPKILDALAAYLRGHGYE